MSINLLGSNLSVISARGRKQDNATLMSQIEAAIVNANKTYGTQNTTTAKNLVNQLKIEVLNNNLTPARAANYMLALGATNVQLKTLDGGGQALIATVFGTTFQCSFAQIPGGDSFSKIVPGVALNGQPELPALITSLKNAVNNINKITNQTTKNFQIRSFISSMMSNFQQGKLSLPNIINALNTIGVSDVQVQTMSNGRQKLMVNFCGTLFQAMTNGIPQNVKGVMADVSINAAVSIAGDKASDILSNLSNGNITTSAAVSQLKSAGLAVTTTTSGALTNYSYSVDGKRYEIITNGTTTTSTTGTSSLANDYLVMATKISSMAEGAAKTAQIEKLLENMTSDFVAAKINKPQFTEAAAKMKVSFTLSKPGELVNYSYTFNGKTTEIIANGQACTVYTGKTASSLANDYVEMATKISSMANGTAKTSYTETLLTNIMTDVNSGKVSVRDLKSVLSKLEIQYNSQGGDSLTTLGFNYNGKITELVTNGYVSNVINGTSAASYVSKCKTLASVINDIQDYDTFVAQTNTFIDTLLKDYESSKINFGELKDILSEFGITTITESYKYFQNFIQFFTPDGYLKTAVTDADSKECLDYYLKEVTIANNKSGVAALSAKQLLIKEIGSMFATEEMSSTNLVTILNKIKGVSNIEAGFTADCKNVVRFTFNGDTIAFETSGPVPVGCELESTQRYYLSKVNDRVAAWENHKSKPFFSLSAKQTAESRLKDDDKKLITEIVQQFSLGNISYQTMGILLEKLGTTNHIPGRNNGITNLQFKYDGTAYSATYNPLKIIVSDVADIEKIVGPTVKAERPETPPKTVASAELTWSELKNSSLFKDPKSGRTIQEQYNIDYEFFRSTACANQGQVKVEIMSKIVASYNSPISYACKGVALSQEDQEAFTTQFFLERLQQTYDPSKYTIYINIENDNTPAKITYEVIDKPASSEAGQLWLKEQIYKSALDPNDTIMKLTDATVSRELTQKVLQSDKVFSYEAVEELVQEYFGYTKNNFSMIDSALTAKLYNTILQTLAGGEKATEADMQAIEESGYSFAVLSGYLKINNNNMNTAAYDGLGICGHAFDYDSIEDTVAAKIQTSNGMNPGAGDVSLAGWTIVATEAIISAMCPGAGIVISGADTVYQCLNFIDDLLADIQHSCINNDGDITDLDWSHHLSNLLSLGLSVADFGLSIFSAGLSHSVTKPLFKGLRKLVSRSITGKDIYDTIVAVKEQYFTRPENASNERQTPEINTDPTNPATGELSNPAKEEAIQLTPEQMLDTGAITMEEYVNVYIYGIKDPKDWVYVSDEVVVTNDFTSTSSRKNTDGTTTYIGTKSDGTKVYETCDKDGNLLEWKSVSPDGSYEQEKYNPVTGRKTETEKYDASTNTTFNYGYAADGKTVIRETVAGGNWYFNAEYTEDGQTLKYREQTTAFGSIAETFDPETGAHVSSDEYIINPETGDITFNTYTGENKVHTTSMTQDKDGRVKSNFAFDPETGNYITMGIKSDGSIISQSVDGDGTTRTITQNPDGTATDITTGSTGVILSIKTRSKNTDGSVTEVTYDPVTKEPKTIEIKNPTTGNGICIKYVYVEGGKKTEIVGALLGGEQVYPGQTVNIDGVNVKITGIIPGEKGGAIINSDSHVITVSSSGSEVMFAQRSETHASWANWYDKTSGEFSYDLMINDLNEHGMGYETYVFEDGFPGTSEEFKAFCEALLKGEDVTEYEDKKGGTGGGTGGGGGLPDWWKRLLPFGVEGGYTWEEWVAMGRSTLEAMTKEALSRDQHGLDCPTSLRKI